MLDIERKKIPYPISVMSTESHKLDAFQNRTSTDSEQPAASQYAVLVVQKIADRAPQNGIQSIAVTSNTLVLSRVM
jgi:hypothetical protein